MRGSAVLNRLRLIPARPGTEYGLAVLADTLITYAIWSPILLASKKYAVPFATLVGAKSIESDDADDDAGRVEMPQRQPRATTFS